jgi:hypothetical protein
MLVLEPALKWGLAPTRRSLGLRPKRAHLAKLPQKRPELPETNLGQGWHSACLEVAHPKGA